MNCCVHGHVAKTSGCVSCELLHNHSGIATGSRVMLIDETRSPTAYPQVGTANIRPGSHYAVVTWDGGLRETYRQESLRVVAGEDAKPRHDWNCIYPGEEACLDCKVTQTEENYLGACDVRKAATI